MRRGAFRGKGQGAARRRRALALLFGALALLARIALAAPSPPDASGGSGALIALAALAGGSAVLCGHAEDGSRKPIHASDCADLCCQTGHQSAALLPQPPAIAAFPVLALATAPPPSADPPRLPRPALGARPRGPPFPV